MFTVRKIGASSTKAAAYYTEEFHREDYYTKSEEPPGIWVGGESLGLSGREIRSEDLRLLFEGRDLEGKALVQGAGEGHMPGWDMVFSAPKSVSILWGTSDTHTREAIREAHRKAVEETLGFLQESSLSNACRRGKAGHFREAPKDLFVATFEHGTSREHDPQLHTHAILLNVAQRKDGTYGSLQPDGIYTDAKTLGALYRAELATSLRQSLGIEFERDGDSLRVVGVGRDVERLFSKRREAIEKELERQGFSGAKASDVAALTTRTRKETKARETLFADWKEEAKSLGFSAQEAIEVSRKALRERQELEKRTQEMGREGKESLRDKGIKTGRETGREKEREELVVKALGVLSEGSSTFTKKKLFERIAVEAQEKKSSKEIREVFRESIENREILSLDGESRKGEALYTTKSMRKLEERILSLGKDMSEKKSKVISWEKTLSRMGEESRKSLERLSEEQVDVVKHVSEGRSLTLVQGWAGAGKSTAMEASREVFEAQGLEVFGIAPTGKAAENLSEGAKIPSKTIDSFLLSKAKDLRGEGKGVLIVDEAGMVGSRKMEALLSLAKEKQARVVLVGDSRQLSSLDAGAPFRVLEKHVGSKSLSEIRRQEILWQREAVKAFAEGRAMEGLAAYREGGFLSVKETGKERDLDLIESWRKATVTTESKRDVDRVESKGVKVGGNALILASANAHVESLNQQAREQWKQAGLVRGKEHVIEVSKKSQGKDVRGGEQTEERVFSKGDRIVFLRNEREIGVTNGQFGTVEQIVSRKDRSGLQVKVNLDNGRRAYFNTDKYNHIDHGYASTVYKSQGSTIDRVFVAHTPGMGRESAYVALSRHKVGLEIFVAKDSFGDGEWERFREKPAREEEKKALVEAQIESLMEKMAKDMEREKEKMMSVEFEVREERGVEVAEEKVIEREEKIEVKEKVKERGVENEMSIGMGWGM